MNQALVRRKELELRAARDRLAIASADVRRLIAELKALWETS